MAETDLTVAIHHPRLKVYKSLAQGFQRTYFVTSASAGLVIIYLLACPWGPAFACANPQTTTVAVITVLALFLAQVVVNLITFACSDELIINRDGLSLPLLLGKWSGITAWQSWVNVVGATVTGASDSDRCLLLQLQSGRSVALPLSGIMPQSLEQLLLSIELWGTRCVRSQELSEFQSELHNNSKGLGGISYTSMWNEELGRRFTSTTFVPLEPGANLQNGRLTVVRQLAFGGLSAIYLVQDRQKEMRVLKEAVVPASMEIKNHEAAEEALQREANILAQLNHPNIVKVIDHFAESGQHYLLLEHITGQDLRQLVRQNGPQDVDKVLDWAVQLASAIEYLHTWEPPILHRDLTPENVVLKNDGTIVIIDFGASNQFLGTMTGTIVGKQAYMAPEQLQGRASTKSDIYSFGGTVYFLLTGKDPVPLSESRPSAFVETPAELEELVVRCTNLDPNARYGSISEIRSELNRQYSEKGIGKIYKDSN